MSTCANRFKAALAVPPLPHHFHTFHTRTNLSHSPIHRNGNATVECEQQTLMMRSRETSMAVSAFITVHECGGGGV
jgi:hypothetical protein